MREQQEADGLAALGNRTRLRRSMRRSTRTLQRRLRKRGLVYAALAGEVRRHRPPESDRRAWIAIRRLR